MPKFAQVLLVLLFVCVVSLSIAAQVAKPEKENEFSTQPSLEGLTEAVLVNGQPTLKIVGQKRGANTEVKLEKRDGEKTLVFNVVKSSVKNPIGKLHFRAG